jgi:hypothetical protein
MISPPRARFSTMLAVALIGFAKSKGFEVRSSWAILSSDTTVGCHRLPFVRDS